MLPELQEDISLLADFADTYDGAADDLLAVLDNLAVTNTTSSTRQEQLRRTFTVGASSSNMTAGFLETNERNLISLAETSRPVLGVFAEYSPIYPCLLEGLARSDPDDRGVLRGRRRPGAEPEHRGQPSRRGTRTCPGDQPAYADSSGPDCRGLANIDGDDRGGAGRRVLLPGRRRGRRRLRRQPVLPATRTASAAAAPRTSPTRAPVTRTPAGQSMPYNLAGSTAELDFVRSILGYQTGTEPGEVSDLSASTLAPLLRGTQVMFRVKGRSVRRSSARAAGQARRSSRWSRSWPATC